MTKNNIWKREENLENVKEAVAKFGEKISTEVRKQEKQDKVEKKDFIRRKLVGKYIAKILYK